MSRSLAPRPSSSSRSRPRIATLLRPIHLRSAWAALALLATASPATAQTVWEEVEIETVPVAEGVYMLTGRGGNIGVSVGPDGAFLVDDQYAPLTDRILSAVAALTDGSGPPTLPFVINTHWHGDHVGGNEGMGEAGAVLVAHDNVRERMEVDQVLERFGRIDSVPAAVPGALPVVTFTEEVTFHLNGDEVEVIHVPHAHTDGDAIVHFSRANVVHMGDTYFAAGYPFIDLSSGGSIDGLLAALGRGLALMDGATRVIPGHGPLSDRDGLREYRDMLRTIRDRVAGAKREGRSLEEILEMGLTEEWDAEWGGGFIGPDALVAAVYRSLPRSP